MGQRHSAEKRDADRHQRRFRRLCIEPLADRRLLAMFSLVPGVPDGAAGSLREAITMANGNSEDDVILLAAGAYPLSVIGVGDDTNATGDLDVASDDASGSVHTIRIVGSGTATIDASLSADRVLHVLPEGNLSISNVTIHGGRAAHGVRGVDREVGERDDGGVGGMGVDGGGILNQGLLRLDQVLLRDNQAGQGGDGGTGGATSGRPRGGGEGGGGGRGGGIFNTGQLTIVDSLLVRNRAGAGGMGGMGGVHPDGSVGSGRGQGGAGGHGGNGGAVFDSGQLTIIDSQLLDNQAGVGGAGGAPGDVTNAPGGLGGDGGGGAGVQSLGSSMIRGVLFENNSGGAGGRGGRGREGGRGGDGGAILSQSMLSLDQAVLRNNRAGQGGDGGRGGAGADGGLGGSGGGIFNVGQLTIENSDLLTNLAGAGGSGGEGVFTDGGEGGRGGDGGAAFSAGQLTINNSRLVDNQAGTGGTGGAGADRTELGANGGDGGWGSNGGRGGAVYSSGSLMIQDVLFENNSAGPGGRGGRGGNAMNGRGGRGGVGRTGGNAGAIQLLSGATLVNTTVRNNRAGGPGLGGSGGTGEVSGTDGVGGAMGPVGGIHSSPDDEGFQLTILASTFVDNIGADTGAVSGLSPRAVLIVRDSLFRANQGGRYAGGLTLQSGSAAIYDSRFEQNTGGVGGIFNSDGTLSIARSTVVNNHATEFGGGVAGNLAQMTISDSLIADNRAPIGGGVYSRGARAVEIQRSTIKNNQATNGGGIYSIKGRVEPEVSLTDSFVVDNRATEYGGGVAALGGQITIANTLIAMNRAAAGGGVYRRSGTRTTMTDSTVANNQATEFGGGLAADPAQMTITDSLIADNRAPSGGGVSSRGNVRILRSTVMNNQATTGGGVFNRAVTGAVSEVTITESLIAKNQAATGGGIYSFATTGRSVSTIAIVRSRVMENQATGAGGAGALSANTGGATARLVISDSLVAGNRAATGGGVHQAGNTRSETHLVVHGSTFSGNVATLGGAIATSLDSSLARLVNSTISGNSADRGGGFYLLGGVFLTNTTIADNSAVTAGGGVHAEMADNVNLKNSLVIGNRAPLGKDVFGNLISEGHNLVGDATGSNIVVSTGDIVGTADAPIPPASVIQLNLADHGGPTPTHALVRSGMAIDAGGDEDTECHSIPGSDQRGQPRPADGNGDGIPRVDIGSVEFVGTNVENGEPLIVTSLVPTPTGFIAELNGELVSTALNLYDAQTGGAGPPDVLLDGATVGRVSGSLVVDPSLRKVTFLKTGGTLAADLYTVTLRSAGNGFKDLAGGLLDGDGNGSAGGDFSDTFLVEGTGADAITVSLFDFVRGPGQQVNVPANTASGIPLSISDGLGVRSGVIEIEYNPAYLNITAATPGAAMPTGASVTLDGSVAGIARLEFSSPSDLPAGTITLIDLQATVPSIIDTRATQHILDVRSAVLSTDLGVRFHVIDDDALHLSSYFGDVSGNGRIDTSDAAGIARIAALLDSGFAATPSTDPVLVGDLSGNGRVNAVDAFLVARSAALIKVPQVPPILTGGFSAGHGVAPRGAGLRGVDFPARRVAQQTGKDTNLRQSNGHALLPIGLDPYQAVDMVMAEMVMADMDMVAEDEDADEGLIPVLEDAMVELVSAELLLFARGH